jgi:hypothetical protein
MTTFDLAEVRNFAADLDARMDRCDNGEGMVCSTLDATLRHYAALCCEFREHVRGWGRAVFAGRVAFDPSVEQVWHDGCSHLARRAFDVLMLGEKAEVPCGELDGKVALAYALLELYRLLDGWVTPQLAVGPSARRGLNLPPAAAEEVRRRLESLPPLPADWEPADPRRQKLFRILRK